MTRESAGFQRTWHSLWDEMFSAFAASDASLELWNADFGVELQTVELFATAALNDNATGSSPPAAGRDLPFDNQNRADW